jgi:hypothetical protein
MSIKRNKYIHDFGVKAKGKRPPERPRHRSKDTIKMELGEVR